MSIEQNSPARTINYMGCLGLGIAFFSLFMVLIFLVFAGERTRLDCSRDFTGQVGCQINGTFLGLWIFSRIEVPRVERARVGEHCDQDGDCLYRVEITTPRGHVPLTEFYSAEREPKELVVDSINRFIRANNPDQLLLDLSGSRRGFLLVLLPVSFVLLGAGLFLFSSRKPIQSSPSPAVQDE